MSRNILDIEREIQQCQPAKFKTHVKRVEKLRQERGAIYEQAALACCTKRQALQYRDNSELRAERKATSDHCCDPLTFGTLIIRLSILATLRIKRQLYCLRTWCDCVRTNEHTDATLNAVVIDTLAIGLRYTTEWNERTNYQRKHGYGSSHDVLVLTWHLKAQPKFILRKDGTASEVVLGGKLYRKGRGHKLLVLDEFRTAIILATALKKGNCA